LEATDKPLAGKSIVVTRAPEQASELTQTLQQMGADVLLLPTVSFAPADDWTSLNGALQEISKFDWLLLTSQNAVRFFCQRCRERGIRPEDLSSPKLRIGAVGVATADAAKQESMRVGYVAKGQTGESFAQELSGELRGRQVLLPRSDRADDRLPNALRNVGAIVTEAVTYRTMPSTGFDSQIMGRIRRGEVDAIVFASPSAFYNLRDSLGAAEVVKLSKNVEFAVIGPTTSGALRESGVRVGIETQESSSKGLANAIASHYQSKNSTVRHS
jgi:uroporphyrinogen-III synthase